MHVTCPTPVIRFYLLPFHICLIDVYRRREVGYQCTIFDRWNICHDLFPSWSMSVCLGSFCICFDVCKYRTCDRAVQEVSGRFHTEGAGVRSKVITSEICVKVAVKRGFIREIITCSHCSFQYFSFTCHLRMDNVPITRRTPRVESVPTRTVQRKVETLRYADLLFKWHVTVLCKIYLF
jgi:hypothetical protein